MRSQSDDTQLAFWTIEQMLEDGDLVPDRLAGRFASDRIFGLGSAVRAFLREWSRTGNWLAAGQESAGNGALMQIAPVLLPHLREPTTALWSDAALAGAVTHNDYASNGARVAFVALLWDALAASRPVQPASDSNRPRVILGLTEDELPFYDALRVNDAAVKVMGDRILRAIAKELTDIIRKNVTIDWTQRVSARAKLRTMVKRLLRKHGYPPDKQEQATTTVMEQAERLCETWAEEGMLQTSSTGS